MTTAYEIRGAGDSSTDALDFDDDDWFAGLTVGSDLNTTREEADIALAGTEVELARIGIRGVEARLGKRMG